jgi:hypothetical protein
MATLEIRKKTVLDFAVLLIEFAVWFFDFSIPGALVQKYWRKRNRT